MRTFLIPILVAVLLTACDDGCEGYKPAPCPDGGCKSDQIRMVEAMGMRDVAEEGYPFFECGKDDDSWSNIKFRAIGQNGAPVHGAVCCGLYKGCTVRFR